MVDTACAAPHAPSPPPPDRFDQAIDVWNPGGDPSVLRRAAQAWRDMASELRMSTSALDHRASALDPSWQGMASDAFRARWQHVRKPVLEGADNFDQVASKLDEVAAQIEETNQQVHALYISIGATVAIGIAVSIVTVGFGSAGAAAAAAAQAQQASTIVARLATFLTISARTMSGFRAALIVFGQRWAVSAVGNILATGAQKAIFNPDHNPLDGWTPSDATRIVLSATAGAAVNSVAAHSARWSPLARAHPLGTSFGTGMAANFSASLVNDTWVDDRALSGTTARNALVNGLGGGASNMVASGAARLIASGAGRARTAGGMFAGPRLSAVQTALWTPKGALSTSPSSSQLFVPRASLWTPQRLWTPQPLLTPQPLPGMTIQPQRAPAPIGPLQGQWNPDALVGIPIDAAIQGGATAPFAEKR